MRRMLISTIALAGCLTCIDGKARELAVAEADLLSAEIVGVQAAPGREMAAVLLKVDQDTLPVYIGIVEAMAIERARRGMQTPRPLTHDLLGDVIVIAGLRLQRLVIDELTEDGNFLAALELQPAGGGPLRRVDSRPSDGMALAARSGARIVVARQVVEKARAAEEGSAPDDSQRQRMVRPIET